jgi:hypothetical protein
LDRVRFPGFYFKGGPEFSYGFHQKVFRGQTVGVPDGRFILLVPECLFGQQPGLFFLFPAGLFFGQP